MNDVVREKEKEQGYEPAPSLPRDALLVIPVRGMVLFPGIIAPITVGREKSVSAAQEAARHDLPVGILTQRDPDVDEPGPDDLYRIGTAGSVMRYVTAPDGTHFVVVSGDERFRIVEWLEGYPFLAARVQRLPDPEVSGKEVEARLHSLRERALELFELLPQVPAELVGAVRNVARAGPLADLVTSFLDLSADEKQEVLETTDVPARMDKVLRILAHRIEVMKLSREIGQRTRETMDEQQREYLLREQLKQIRKQLGDTDDHAEEIAELTRAVDAAGMTEEAREQAKKEIKRLEHMPEAAGEYSMVRTWLDWMIELPWSKETATAIDIAEARNILEADHYGLEKIKKRILEYLAVRKLNPSGRSPLLCFVGPPGVGKTSLGQSIARATGRKFVRISLGGVHDEAEIRGHRRTYIGALPGNIIQGIRKAGARDCLFMLDEMDKIGMGGFHGDPSSALMEVLDPEQNFAFRDNYLAVPFDLSKVLFIGTANILDTIPGPLRDRMEVIDLPGYTEAEKMQIARRYLVKRQLDANGLKPEQCEITDAAIQAIIGDYTREAGVRNLEREIGSALRHVAVQIAEGKIEKGRVDAPDLGPILGPPKFESEVAMRTGIPGVATGLAWTPTGGDILFIEASRVPGGGKLILTGHLGDVMKESAQAALSLTKGRLTSLGLADDALEHSDVHIHVPAGATPKDGPSAGVAMFVALVSLLSNRAVKSDLAMTGEISLRGLVLPIGGIKEKVLAAMRAGIYTVLLPERNRKDLEDVPEEAREKVKFVWIENVDDAVRLAVGELGEKPPELTLSEGSDATTG